MRTKKRKLRNVRPRAILGAAISAGATLTAAAMQTAATMNAANRQAAAIDEQAEEQARALERQNENNNRLQEKQVAIQKETSNKIADAITTNQMNLQMIAGNESAKERAAEGRIMVKRGGNIKRRLRNGGYNPTGPLQGSYNMPFEVTDGGDVAYQGSTPEGYDLYEILGDNHEHRHKTRGGKYKSGVGFRFANGGEVEGEGNQGTNQGEYLLVTPDNGYFISKHTINGVNPAGLINRGVHPVDAYNIQEAAKSKRTSFAKRLRCGGRVKALYGIDSINPWRKGSQYYNNYQNGWEGDKDDGVPVASMFYFNGSSYAPNPSYIPESTIVGNAKPIQPLSVNTTPGNLNKPATSNDTDISDKSNFWNSPNGALAINTAANLAGAGIQHLGNLMGQHKLSNAYSRAADIMTKAYGSLQQVDPDTLGLNDITQWRSANYLPAIRSANVNVNPQLQDINRSVLRQQRAVGNNTLSSAAQLNRNSAIEQAAQDNRSKVYADQANREEDIKQKNNQMINQAAAANVQASNQLRQSLASLRADIAKYNNDIANERILGAANAQSQMGINRASAKADAYNATADAYSSAVGTIGNNYYNIWQTRYKSDMDYLNSLALGTPQAQVNSLIYRKSAGFDIDDRYIQTVYSSASPEDKVRMQIAFPNTKFPT